MARVTRISAGNTNSEFGRYDNLRHVSAIFNCVNHNYLGEEPDLEWLFT